MCSEKECHNGNVWLWPGISLVLLIIGMVLEHADPFGFFQIPWIKLSWFVIAFLPVGVIVIKEAFEGLLAKDFFNEFTLMTIASIGAFCIGEYPEGVAVMLFYCIGEILQDKAVDRVKGNISNLLSMKSEKVTLIQGEHEIEATPEEVTPGEVILVRPGERVALDGVLLTADADFDTSALTGESIPRTMSRGNDVAAGMIPLAVPVRIRVTKVYGDSTLARIIRMVSEAQEKKAESVKFITRFAKIYTPVVMIMALALVGIPALISAFNPHFHYELADWLYRGLVFLVISCPCALVISVPLGYFVGIGAASRSGILVKGGNYLDIIRRVDVMAFDKTGTLTTGRLRVKEIVAHGQISEERLISFLVSAESSSSHPLANALVRYAGADFAKSPRPDSIEEISGCGIVANISGKEVLAGNIKLFAKRGIEWPMALNQVKDTFIACAVDGMFAGYVTFDDEIKQEAKETVVQLRAEGIEDLVILSGDNERKAEDIGMALGIKKVYGNLLPDGKASYVQSIAEGGQHTIAFVGDGINDAPVLALSNIGIAMGALGADIAVENADVIIQTDDLSRIPKLIKIGRITHNIIKENIVFAIAIKVAILVLGALGLVSLWAAVFADVGVSVLAILNSLRIFKKTAFKNERMRSF